MSKTVSFRTAPGEPELRKVERLLMELAPHQRKRWPALLNALLVEVENALPDERTIVVVKSAILSLAGIQQSSLIRPLEALIQAARLPTDTQPKITDAKGNTKHYSLGEGMIDMVA